MHIRTCSRIIGEIIAGVLWIIVQNKVIRIPQPAVHINQIWLRDGKVESVEKEPRWASTSQAVHMTWTKCAGEMAVLPGMVHMISASVDIMPDPLPVGVNMRSVRMASPISEITARRIAAWGCVMRLRPVLRNIAAAHSSVRLPMLLAAPRSLVLSAMLRKSRDAGYAQ